MKKITLALCILTVALYFSCDSAGGGGAKGKGGPDNSPEDIQVDLNTSDEQPADQSSTTVSDVTDTKDEVADDVNSNSDIDDMQDISVTQTQSDTDSQDSSSQGTDGSSDDSTTSSDTTTTSTGSDTSTSDTSSGKDIKQTTTTTPVVKDENANTQSDKIIDQVNTTIATALKLAETNNFINAVNNLENLRKEIKKLGDSSLSRPLLVKIDEALRKVDSLKKTYDNETVKLALVEIDDILDKVSDYVKESNTSDAQKMLDDALAKAKALSDAEARKTAVAKVEKALDDLAEVIKVNAAIKKVDDSIASGYYSDALDAVKSITGETAIANALLKIVAAISTTVDTSKTKLNDSTKAVLTDIKVLAVDSIKDETVLTTVIEQADKILTSFITLQIFPQEGKWFTTPTKEIYTKDEWKSITTQVQTIRSQIKTLRAKINKNNRRALQKQINSLRQQIKDIKAKYGYARIQKGIHTYWSKKDLIIRANNIPAEGWYNLIVVAKNISGPLQKNYKSFNLTVSNENLGKDIGGINIPASDIAYQKGKLLIKLEKGDTDLNLKWTNDSYKKKKYDANIQIRKVVLRYAKKHNKKFKKPVRNAHEYSSVNGRWFWDKNSAYTHWQDQSISFSFPGLKSGKYKLIIHAKNYGNLKMPSDYNKFKLNIFADGLDTPAEIPASENWKKGEATLDLTGGDIEIEITWLNDEYKKGVYDTNFQIKMIKLKRIGDSERSAVAAYLLGTSGGSRVMLIGTLMILIMIIGAISLWNRKKADSEA